MKLRDSMVWKGSTTFLLVGVCVAALCVGTFAMVQAPQGQPAAPAGRGGGGGGRGGVASNVFAAADANKDGSVTREKLRAMFAKLLSDGDTAKAGSLTQEQLQTAMGAALAASMPQPTGGGGRGAVQNQVPRPDDVEKMKSALPDKAPAKPKRARKVLVLGKANGYVHSCIPLAAKTIELLGTRTGAWTTAVTYDPADINEQNLRQYDLLFLDNTTGNFLDDPNNPAVTEARRKALLDFVRGGKGLAGIHAATDAYHAIGGAPTPGGGRGGSMAVPIVTQMMTDGDTNHDQKLSRQELVALADLWFDKLDSSKAGRLNPQDFNTRFAALVPPAPPRPANAGPPQGRDRQIGTWPEYNKAIGGFFKFHWLDPQLITVKIDDPKSPLTAMFHGEEWDIHDETYTFGMDTWSRTNLRVLTSIDYAKMSDPDKAKEDYPRADHDYGLSWIRREGKGRVFYEAHGHSERNYAVKLMLEHVLAGAQYAIGDLKADDSPSVKPTGKK